MSGETCEPYVISFNSQHEIIPSYLYLIIIKLLTASRRVAHAVVPLFRRVNARRSSFFLGLERFVFRAYIQKFNKDGECHGKIDVPFWYMLVKSFGGQRNTNQQQKR